MKNKFLTSVKSKFNNNKYNTSKNLFIHLIAYALIIAVGLTLVLTVGFNKGIDFNGGISISVVVEKDLEIKENYRQTVAELNKVINEHDLKASSYRITETNYYGNALTVLVEKPNIKNNELSTLLIEIKESVLLKFYPDMSTTDYEAETNVKVQDFGGSVSSKVIMLSLLAVVVLVVACALYIFARYGLASAMTTLTVAFLDIFATLALISIFRIKIELSLFGVIAFVPILSIILSLLLLTKLKTNSKLEKYSKLTNHEVANVCVKENFSTALVLGGMLLLFALLLGVVPTSVIRHTTLPMLIAVLVCFVSVNFITPGLWSQTFVRKVKKTSNKPEENEVKEEKLNIEEQIDIIKENEVKEDLI